ncbi:MAG: lipocalin-like domain-containing protein [Rhodanobacteraceae bacterium]
MHPLTRADLLGVWTLERFIVHRRNGEDFEWPGAQSGTLIYTADGYVSVAQNREPLANPSVADRARTANFYTGTWQLDLENGTVVHTPLQSSAPSIIGIPAIRTVRLDPDGRLWLSGAGLQERVTLVWRRPRPAPE